jgi:peptidoglycan hydrolase-like protein with peptidoglycan-binding domain
LRFLAVSLAALALAVAVSAQQDTSAKKKAATASAKAKTAHPAAATAKPGASKAPASKSAVSKAGASKSVASRGTASKAAASKTGAKTASKTGTKSHKTVVARRPPTQQQPTADRYKEIQQALADKGYFQGPADGAWNTGSVEALKRFQKDQNLDPDGKIGSLSLIALGLGPKSGEATPPAAKNGAEALPLDPPPVAQPQP